MISYISRLSLCRIAVILAMVLCPVVLGAGSAAREGSSTRDLSRASAPSIGPARARQQRSKAARKSSTRRLREGTIINDQSGYFSENGDTASFISDSGIEFGTLQNLNLERVVRLLKNADEPSSIRWSVTGTVTEFSGRNYILISRAVYKSATPPPAPDRVAN